MDQIDITQAVNKTLNALYKSGKVGRVEPRKTLTYNGNNEGKLNVFVGVNMVKISDIPIDCTRVTVLKIHDSIDATDVPMNMISVVDETNAILMVFDNADSQTPVVMSVLNPISFEGVVATPGTYVLSDGGTYVSYIELTETIHPIDPKYLPGVCLPVVDMSDVIVHNEGVASIALAANQVERIGTDLTPKLIWITVFENIKAMVLMTPAEENGVVMYGGTFVIEGGSIPVWILVAGDESYAIVNVPSA